MPDFLTLEGSNSPRKPKAPSLNSILNMGESCGLGFSDDVEGTRRRESEERKRILKEIREERSQKPTSEEAKEVRRRSRISNPNAEEDAAWQAQDEAANKKTETLISRLTKPTEQGYEKAKGLFSSYGLDFNEGDDLSGWFSRIRRMATPPARVRKVFRRAMTPPRVIRPFVSKVMRYGGAISTMGLTAFGGGKLRNKMFGLKGGELKAFDVAAKVYRVATVAVIAVVGGPAILGSMSKVGGLGFKKFLATQAGKGFLKKKGMSLVMKDIGGNAIWKIAKDGAGKLIASKVDRNQIPPEDYAALPNNVPIPTTAEGEVSRPATVAGTGGMMPGGEDGIPARLGQVNPYDRAAVAEEAAENNPLPFPTATTPDPEGSPANSETDAALPFDQASPSELIAQAKSQAADEFGPQVPEQSDLDGHDPFFDALRVVRANNKNRIAHNAKGVHSRRKAFNKKLAYAKTHRTRAEF